VSDNAPVTAPRLRFTYFYYGALAIAAAFTGRGNPLPQLASHALDCIALLLIVAAALGRIWCSVFIAGHKSTTLITSGPYSVCRHPLYVFSWIGALGMGFATHSAVLTLITAVMFAVLLTRAARAEERFLSLAHPSAFAEYFSVTPRFLPNWRNYRLPESVSVGPVILRKSFWDAGSFILLYLVIDTLRLLREAAVLPTLFAMP
jgi:protein-S-isoprenylcysteine O-methyltransferase Ste14